MKKISALVLACTHYPVIKEKILRQYEALHDRSIEIIDSSEIVAETVKHQLAKHNLLNNTGNSKKNFYLSDYTESFANNAKLFFDDQIILEHYPLWD